MCGQAHRFTPLDIYPFFFFQQQQQLTKEIFYKTGAPTLWALHGWRICVLLCGDSLSRYVCTAVSWPIGGGMSALYCTVIGVAQLEEVARLQRCTVNTEPAWRTAQ